MVTQGRIFAEHRESVNVVSDLNERAELGLPAYPIDPRFLEALQVGIPGQN